MKRDVISGDDDDIHVDDSDIPFERIAKEKAFGAREREIGGTLYGVLRQNPCASGLVCINNTCQSPGKTMIGLTSGSPPLSSCSTIIMSISTSSKEHHQMHFRWFVRACSVSKVDRRSPCLLLCPSNDWKIGPKHNTPCH